MIHRLQRYCFCALLVCSFLFAACAAKRIQIVPSKVSQVEVSIVALEQLTSGHMVVAVGLMAEKLPFVVDTGASITVITPATRKMLGLDEDSDQKLNIMGPGGQLQRTNLQVIDRLALGKTEHIDLQAVEMDLPQVKNKEGKPIAGILGQNFFMQHDLVIDFSNMQLEIHPKGTFAKDSEDLKEYTAVSFRLAAENMLFSAKV